ncbi:MAG TPA: phage tail tape measure protein, partial [Blastocatellia bacterium]|nr:phage tail tape measure protein [Blastocatellia bacterium]
MEIDRLETTLRINDADFYRQMSAAERRMADFGRGIPTSGFDSYMSKITSSLTRAGAMITAGIGLPAALVAKEVLTVGSSFETAFAGVIKTVSATTPELAVMRQSFRDMAKEIPITADELAKIGESAGQLGVKKENILGFTRVMADLGVTTNLTSDQAATALARLANITQMPQESFDRLGATVVALGNAGASTEKDIVEMGLRIAGAGHAAGLTEANILGFANALSSVGIEAEAGGSAISRVFTTMSDAAKLGGKDLQIFAQVAGQSASAFKQSFQTDAAGAAVSFIEGLGKMSSAGLSLTPVLKELELSDIRVRDALLRASGAGDLFRQSLELGSKAWQENTALTNEAAERYKTFDSQVQLLKNALSDVAITLFDKLRPGLVSAVDGLKSIAEAIGKVNPAVLAAGAAFVGVFAAGGAAALAIGGFLTLIGGPLTIAIGLAAAAIGVLAGEWVLDSQKMGQASQSTGETIKQVFQGIAIGAGVIMDTIGVLANSIGLTLKSLALILVDVFSPVILAIGALSGKFTETWELIKRANSRLADDIVVSWDGLTADITGRWTKTMSGMVDTGFEAANQLGAAGSAGGGLYVKGFQHALNNIG